jgi:hypothetical protein
MAWIKMRTNLMTDPRVVRLAVQLRQPRALVVGACYVLWCLADQHSEDGCLTGYTAEILDELTGLQGFSAGMQAVQWLTISPDGLQVPRFDEHNSQSAKQRAQAATRVIRSRYAASVSKACTEKEKEKEKHHHQTEQLPDDADAAGAGRQQPAAGADFSQWAAEQARRPEWLPEGKGWIDQRTWLAMASECPDIDAETYQAILRQAKACRHQLKNPAGYILRKLREAQANTQKTSGQDTEKR